MSKLSTTKKGNKMNNAEENKSSILLMIKLLNKTDIQVIFTFLYYIEMEIN